MESRPLREQTGLSEDELARRIVETAQRQAREQRLRSMTPWERALLIGLKRMTYWITKHWVALFNVMLALYLGLAFLAPVLAKAGHFSAAHTLYRLYSFVCHEYPFRSWFLFGEHSHYPLQAPISIEDMNRSRQFIGGEQWGYKVALCQRDVAIYGSMLVGGMLYSLARRRWRIRPLPFGLVLGFGVLPIALDGGLQWLSYLVWTLFPQWLAVPHETSAFLRTLTGALFGLSLIGFAYPQVDQEFFRETETLLAQQLQQVAEAVEGPADSLSIEELS